MSEGRNTYLEHASGQPLHPAGREVLHQAPDSGSADPRSLHRPPREARLMADVHRLANLLPGLVERLREGPGVPR